jgi:hypothetical protein
MVAPTQSKSHRRHLPRPLRLHNSSALCLATEAEAQKGQGATQVANERLHIAKNT